jgi:catechol 2,3-dioxygenase-like lactoylglutathione lyase family enzyme
MIDGGLITVFVSDMDRAVAFYTDTLGLKLQFRAGNHWASIDAGKGCIIGLHPAGPKSPIPGSSGSLQIGLNVDEPIQQVVDALKAKGVGFKGDVVNDEQGGVKLAFFTDPDGHELYLCESKWG